METSSKRDKREEKHKRIASAIANLEEGEIITPTYLAKSFAKTHPDTLRDFLDSYDSLKGIGFKTLRNPDGVIKAVIKVKENPKIEEEILKLLKEINKKLDK